MILPRSSAQLPGRRIDAVERYGKFMLLLRIVEAPHGQNPAAPNGDRASLRRCWCTWG